MAFTRYGTWLVPAISLNRRRRTLFASSREGGVSIRSTIEEKSTGRRHDLCDSLVCLYSCIKTEIDHPTAKKYPIEQLRQTASMLFFIWNNVLVDRLVPVVLSRSLLNSTQISWSSDHLHISQLGHSIGHMSVFH